MGSEKSVLKPADALKQAEAAVKVAEQALETVLDSQPAPAAPAPAAPAPAAPAPAAPAPAWKFVKNYGVADVLRFKDGSTFTFPLTMSNSDHRYLLTSYVVTSDAKLAENLREVAKNPHSGVVEVKL